MRPRSPNVANVRHYGATGLGAVDDRAAIQSACDALDESGGELCFPPGAYGLHGVVTLRNKRDVRILGPSTVVQLRKATRSLYIVDCDGVTISDLNFVGAGDEIAGPAAGFNGVAGIYLQHCANVVICQCRLSNHGGGGIRWHGDNDGICITQCTVRGLGSPAICGGANRSDGAIGITAQSHDDNVRILGNDISGHAFGIFLYETNAAIIANNIVHDIPGQHGMYLSNTGNVLVTGNVVHSCHLDGIKVQINPRYGDVTGPVTITNNVVRDVGNGINCGDIGGDQVFTNLEISSNHVVRCRAYGINCDGVRNGRVAFNRITRTGSHPIYRRRFTGQLLDNLIS